ncbi:MAG: carbamoyltransferase [Patescibacteria group bacterium]
MFILGISCFYHDSAAALLKDGKIIAASEEERFTRIKHDNSFPQNAIEFCLQKAGITAKELDAVIFYEKPLIKFERILYNTIATFPKSFLWFMKAMPQWIEKKLWFGHLVKKHIGYTGKVYYGDHHTSHVASSFYSSNFQECAYLTADGVGEWTTTSIGVIKNGQIQVLKELHYPHSLGLLYSTFTAFLGFEVNNGEYKVMGLASYGKPKYKDIIYKHLIDVAADGSMKLNMEYFGFHHSFLSYNQKFIGLFGETPPPEKEFTEKAADIAASIQKVTEEIILKQVNHLWTLAPSENLCLAGGVALNCVANAEILKHTNYKNLYIQPAAGDAGCAVGAAYFLWNQFQVEKFESEKKPYTYHPQDPWIHAYYGSDGSDYKGQDIKEFLEKESIKFKHYGDEKDLIETVAQLVSENKVVGWFQGRQEFGPRALGHRSIIGNPACRDMQEILNVKIKHREKFRPFAPSVAQESTRKYFELGTNDSPFMLLIAPVKAELRDKLPAITHVDGSARLQTVTPESEPLYHALIKKVGEKTGFDIIVNTSFNIRGEPIVRTPQEAFQCFASTDMDVLVLGNFVIFKEDLDPEKIIKVDPKKIHEKGITLI